MATNPDIPPNDTPPASDTPPVDPPADPPSGDDPPSDPPDDKPPAANDDWRAEWAGEDPDLAKFLGRFQSPAAAIAKYKEQHGEIRSGKFIKPLGDAPTDDEIAAYRGAFGVPDAAEGYLDALPDGLVVGDDDKPFVDQFIEGMHGVNAPKATVDAALSAYYKIVEGQAADEAETANSLKNQSIEDLRTEWGPDYKRNMNIMHSHLDGMPEVIKDVFTNGQMADGTPIGYNAEVLKWLTGQALEANPVATVVPGAGANQSGAIADELASLTKLMGNPQSDYWKGPMAEKNQARFLELTEAQQKLDARG